MGLGKEKLPFSTIRIPFSVMVVSSSFSNNCFDAVLEVITSGIPKKILLFLDNCFNPLTVDISFSHEITVFAF